MKIELLKDRKKRDPKCLDGKAKQETVNDSGRELTQS